MVVIRSASYNHLLAPRTKVLTGQLELHGCQRANLSEKNTVQWVLLFPICLAFFQGISTKLPSFLLQFSWWFQGQLISPSYSRPFDLALRQLGLIGPATRWRPGRYLRGVNWNTFLWIYAIHATHTVHTQTYKHIYICTYKTNRHIIICLYTCNDIFIYIWTIVLISRFFGDPYFYSKNPTHPEPNGGDGNIIELGDCPSPWLPEGSNHWKFHELMKLFVFQKK